MSWARFSDGDVYIFRDVRGGITCCACKLTADNLLDRDNFNCATPLEMYRHILDHAAAGHDIPHDLLDDASKEVGAAMADVDGGGNDD